MTASEDEAMEVFWAQMVMAMECTVGMPKHSLPHWVGGLYCV